MAIVSKRPAGIVYEGHAGFLNGIFRQTTHHLSVNAKLFPEEGGVVLVNQPSRIHAIGTKVTSLAQLPSGIQKKPLGEGEILVRIGFKNAEPKLRALQKNFPAYSQKPRSWGEAQIANQPPSHFVVEEPSSPLFAHFKVGTGNSVKLLGLYKRNKFGTGFDYKEH